MDMALPLATTLSDEAIHALFVTSAPRLSALAVHMLQNHEDAADALQEAWLRAWRARGEIRDPATVNGWLRSIVARECYRALRWRAMRRWLPFGDSVPEVPTERPDTVDAHRVRRLVAQLSPQQQACWSLRFHEGLTVGEIAEALDLSSDTVKTHLSRALATVQRRLEVPRV